MAIHVDSEELRSFAAQLKRFNEVLGQNMKSTQGQIAHLGESWRDDEFAQFRDVFAKTYPTMQAFIAEAEAAIPPLLRDAEAIEEFAQLKAN